MKSETVANNKPQQQSNLFFFSFRIAFVVGFSLIIVGGFFDWIYLNSQEFSVGFFDAQISYLESYISGFVISVVEITAGIYFIEKYELGIRKKTLFLLPLIVGVISACAYVVAEFFSGVSLLNGIKLTPTKLIVLELSPVFLDYGNAVIIGLSTFSLVFILSILFRLNPMPKSRASSDPIATKAPSLLGGLWSGLVTGASAMLCCGPLPGTIALTSGISSLYFTALINLQPFLVLIGLPALVFAIILADRRAKSFCKLR